MLRLRLGGQLAVAFAVPVAELVLLVGATFVSYGHLASLKADMLAKTSLRAKARDISLQMLSARYATRGAGWTFASSAYWIKSSMTLWNDYTHYLDDPVNGDQEQQSEDRDTWGGQAGRTRHDALGPFASDTTVGVQGRYDDAYVDRRHTHDRQVLN